MRGCENLLVAVQYGRLPTQGVSPLRVVAIFEACHVECAWPPSKLDPLLGQRRSGPVWEPPKPAGMAFVAFSPKWPAPKCAYLSVPDTYLRVRLPRKTQIMQAETLAVALVPRALGSLLLGCDLLHFMDNQGALSTLIKGYFPHENCAAICAMIHLLHAKTQTREFILNTLKVQLTSLMRCHEKDLQPQKPLGMLFLSRCHQ